MFCSSQEQLVGFIHRVLLIGWLLKDFGWMTTNILLAFPFGIISIVFHAIILYVDFRQPFIFYNTSLLMWVIGNFLWMTLELLVNTPSSGVHVGPTVPLGGLSVTTQTQITRIKNGLFLFSTFLQCMMYISMFYRYIPIPQDENDESSELVKAEITHLYQCCCPGNQRRRSKHGTHERLSDQSSHHNQLSPFEDISTSGALTLNPLSPNRKGQEKRDGEETEENSDLTATPTTITNDHPSTSRLPKEEDEEEMVEISFTASPTDIEIGGERRGSGSGNGKGTNGYSTVDTIDSMDDHHITTITDPTTTSTTSSTPPTWTVLFLENMYILFWISKDLFWSFGTGDFYTRHPRSLIIAFEIIAMVFGSLAIYSTAIVAYGYYAHDTIKYLDAITTICWICANYLWMSGEFFLRYDHLLYDDADQGNDTFTRVGSMIMFITGLAIQWYLAIYFFLLRKKPVKREEDEENDDNDNEEDGEDEERGREGSEETDTDGENHRKQQQQRSSSIQKRKKNKKKKKRKSQKMKKNSEVAGWQRLRSDSIQSNVTSEGEEGTGIHDEDEEVEEIVLHALHSLQDESGIELQTISNPLSAMTTVSQQKQQQQQQQQQRRRQGSGKQVYQALALQPDEEDEEEEDAVGRRTKKTKKKMASSAFVIREVVDRNERDEGEGDEERENEGAGVDFHVYY